MRIFVLLVFTLNSISAQKVINKSLIDSSISYVQIDASNCFMVTIQTHATDEVVVEAVIDGEYRKDLVLNVNEEGNSVLVSAGFRPNFENPNDKLSAHKVVSIALKIIIPEKKNVRVSGTNANVLAIGSYEGLKITLNDGISHLKKVVGSADIISQSGDIIVESKSAEIISSSKYGKIGKNQIPAGDTKYLLNTVTGDISFKRIE